MATPRAALGGLQPWVTSTAPGKGQEMAQGKALQLQAGA
jgi:hypothetical protein